MDAQQKRVILWTCPRSISTAFYRAITNAPGTLGIFQPYSSVYTYLVERKDADTCTHKEITTNLLKPYEGHDVVFVKDMAYCLRRSPNSVKELLPEGYIHTFLIRDPRKSVPSLIKIVSTEEGSETLRFDRRMVEFKPLYDMYTLLTKELGLKCLVVDADDLEENPEAIITGYCNFVGIPFHPSMIDWKLAGSSKYQTFLESTTVEHIDVFFKAAQVYSTIKKPENPPSLDYSGQPLIIREVIEENMPLYNLMYKDRLIVDL